MTSERKQVPAKEVVILMTSRSRAMTRRSQAPPFGSLGAWAIDLGWVDGIWRTILTERTVEYTAAETAAKEIK